MEGWLFMANRKRSIEEKAQSVKIALGYINIEAATREAGTPASTLRYDLNKVKMTLSEILLNQRPGPKPQNKPDEVMVTASGCEEPTVCPLCWG